MPVDKDHQSYTDNTHPDRLVAYDLEHTLHNWSPFLHEFAALQGRWGIPANIRLVSVWKHNHHNKVYMHIEFEIPEEYAEGPPMPKGC